MKVSTKKAELEQQINQLEIELKNIEKSAAFKKELVVMRALNNLMKKHQYSKRDLIDLLRDDRKTPEKRITKTIVPRVRKQRKLKIYRNPNTGEEVSTRGGNHKTLKSWKSKYDLQFIDDWLIKSED